MCVLESQNKLQSNLDTKLMQVPFDYEFKIHGKHQNAVVCANENDILNLDRIAALPMRQQSDTEAIDLLGWNESEKKIDSFCHPIAIEFDFEIK